MSNHTQCLVVGGGPAGVVLAYMLARNGVQVTLIEAQKDFDREFRGDTLHPSVMEIMEELGLAKKILKLEHIKAKKISLMADGNLYQAINFDWIKDRTKYPYVTLMPQDRFLDFMTEESKKFTNFRLMMETKAEKLIEKDGKVIGVKTNQGEILADLMVGADGRWSTLRELARIKMNTVSPPMDIYWFKLPKEAGDDDIGGGRGNVKPGKILAQLDRGDYWQLGLVIAKTEQKDIHKQGLKAFQDRVIEIVPSFEKRVRKLNDWKQVSTFIVEAGRVDQWYKPGLLLIGDAAHIMSPVGGVGINYAIMDAVEAANILSEPLKDGKLSSGDLATVQSARIWSTRLIQWFQNMAHNQILKQALRPDQPLSIPWFAKFEWLRKIIARFLAFGPKKIHVKKV